MAFRIFGIPTLSVDCIVDRAHNALEEINITLNNNHGLANILIIFTSLFIDFMSASTILYWFFRYNLKNTKIGFIFYFVKQFKIGIRDFPILYDPITAFISIKCFYKKILCFDFILTFWYTPKFPEGHYFPYPGFPSLTVPYGR